MKTGNGTTPVTPDCGLQSAEVEAVIEAGPNVFADLLLPASDRALAKARLAIEVCRAIRQLRLTEEQAAERLGIDRPEVSALARGRLGGFSTGRLLRFLTALGRDVDIVIRPASADPDRAALRVLASAEA